MKRKRMDLTTALRQTSGRVRSLREATEKHKAAAPRIEEAISNQNFRSKKAAARIGKKAIGGWFDPEVSHQFLRIRLDRGGEITLQEMLAEAFNDYFERHGLPRIA